MLEALMKKKNQDGRFRYLYWIVIFIFAALICRLVYLQLFEGSYYHGLADGNRLRAIPIAAMRGVMYDRNGQILVGSRPSFMVTYVPTKKGISDAELDSLSKLLNVPKDKLQEKIAKGKNSFEPTILAQDLTQDIVTRVEERRNDLPGVSVDVQPIRYYPYNSMAAQVFGYVGQIDEEDMKRLKGQEGVSSITQIGRAGLEAYYDDLLRGKDGGRQVEVDASGTPVKEMERKNPVPGHNFHLTIDLNLQKATEDALDRQVANGIGTHGIAAVAIDPNTGAVLAMASRPSYNPNWFTRGITEKEWAQINNPAHPMENRVIAGEYPPGSTFKLITGTAALELKKVTPDELIFDSGRHWLVDMRNAGGEALGWLNFTEALAKSDNVYFYELGRRVGIDKLAEYARMFGMGKKTGIALRGEATGLVASEEYKKKNFNQDWYLGDTFNSAIGQGFQLVTPLQAAMIVSEVANGGIQYKPFLVSRIDNLDGTPYKIFAPEQVGTLPVSKSTLDLVREGMRNVAEESGTAGSLFAGFPIQVAGKTGTAENFGGADHAWFVAYAPFDHPRIVIAVLTEQGGFGALASGPVAKSMLEEFFQVGAYADGKSPAHDGKDKKN